MKKIYAISGIVFFQTINLFLATGVFAQEHQSDLKSLIKIAQENNPEIKAAYDIWQAAEHKTKYISSLPDPTLQYTYFGENVQTKVGPQEQKYSVSQKIPFPGKLSLKKKVQLQEAKKLQEKYKAIQNEIIKRISFTYYDLYLAQRSIQISEQEKQVIQSIEDIVQKNYESNQAQQQDVIKAQLELSRLIDKLLQLQQSRNRLISRMNYLLGIKESVKIPSEIKISDKRISLTLEQLKAIALTLNQELQIAKLEETKNDFQLNLARKEYAPDLSLGFEYIQVGAGSTSLPEDGEDAWMGSVKVNVPLWWGKQNAQVNESRELKQASRKDADNTENKLIYEIEDVYYKIQEYQKMISLYESALMPQAEQAQKVAKTAYISGKTKFIDWLDTERIVLQTKLAYHKAVSDYFKSIAFLERLVGTEL